MSDLRAITDELIQLKKLHKMKPEKTIQASTCDQITLWGTKNPLTFASLPTCGFVAQLVVALN